MKQKNKDISKSLQDLDNKERQLQIEKELVLQKAFASNNADAIFKAQEYVKNVEPKKETPLKSMFIDPSGVLTGGGYLDKGFTISYDVLRRMSTIPIVKAILETRKEQVLNFCEPQKDKYSPGFIIRPKNFDETKDLNRNQTKRIEELTEFILNCGDSGSDYHGDNFNSFTRKFIGDSLCLDQATAELVYNRKGELTEFIATDGASYRIADSHNDEYQSNEKMKKGYLPYYVQLYNGSIYAEFYPWELIFAIRNPQTSIYSNGYGKSELEDLVGSVTSLINSDTYNSNYFKVGSNPKGILKISGNINGSRLEEFRNQWTSQVAGVRNSHKLPVIEADKMDFINTQASNKDMEFAHFQEYLIKLICASYKIDPSEIGFPMSGSSDAKPMFEGNNESRLKFSKDKGLKPLLKFYQHYTNKYILNTKDPNYEFIFVGLDAENPEQELERNIKEVSNYKTVNEVRASAGLEKIEGGDIILNPIFFQAQMAAQQGNQESNDSIEQQGEEPNPFAESDNEDENPFLKAITEETNKYFEIS